VKRPATSCQRVTLQLAWIDKAPQEFQQDPEEQSGDNT
jgi:hypothetical protein